jgi:DNA (cytosine-5)-methyltransferase 1
MSKSQQLQIRLEESKKALLDRLCQQEQVTVSEKIREMIEGLIESQSKAPEQLPMKKTKSSQAKTAQVPVFNKEKKRTFTVGEMYSGPGGIGTALSKTRLHSRGLDFSFEHVWATDYDPDTCRTYKNNLLKGNPNAISICDDIRNVDIKKLPVVDGFLYGFPCNDFSQVGESLGLKGKFGRLYEYGVEYINHANPLFIFAENVSGIGSSNSGKAFELILSELNNAGIYGYDLAVHHYKFEEYGVPQARHRYIIVGTRGDLGLHFKVPTPSLSFKTCKEAIEIPRISADAHNNELTRQSKVVVERLKLIKPGENVWTADLPDHLKLNVKGATISQIYKRLDPTKPSYTVTGSGGGGTHVYHWDEPRALTNRERARLQTFPDDFIFYGSKESVRAQIGMAVPVDGAKIILDALLKTFAGKAYDSIDPSNGFFKSKSLKLKARKA